MNNKPTVSIVCFTYNQEPYIRNALDGFLMQKTDYEVEIIIHDDASTDGTISVLKEYEKRYHQRLHVIYEAENQYSKFKYPPQFSFQFMKRETKGKYIAMCEGDDYWTDPNKLQLQVEYMENHPDCVMTGHDIVLLNCRTGKKESVMLYDSETDISAHSLISGEGDISTVSLVYRREILDMDGFFLKVCVGDYPLKLYSLAKGRIHYFSNPMATYRFLREESWSDKQEEDRGSYLLRWINIFAFLDRYNEYTEKNYDRYITDFINQKFNTLPLQFCNLSVERFLSLCDDCDKKEEYEAHHYCIGLMNLFRQHFDDEFLDDRIFSFTRRFKHIVIWGAGNYGRRCYKQLKNHGVEIEGFVVSDDQDNDKMCLDKNVWKVNELPYDIQQTGFIIAVGIDFRTEVFAVLEKNKINHYMYPFTLTHAELKDFYHK